MKHLTLVIILVISSLLTNAQGWMWAKHFNGTGSNQPIAMVQDVSGNYYVYGNFNGTVTQDAITLNTYGVQDIFLSKYNSQGEIQWIKQIGGSGTETAIGLALSYDGNYLYTSGQTNGNCSFGDGYSFSTAGVNDIFLAKYDLSGTCQWAHQTAYGTTQQINGAITVDSEENIILAGAFVDNVTFFEDAATLNAVTTGIRQNFIAKFNQNGNYIWSKAINSDDAYTYIKSVSTYNNEYYFGGQYSGIVDFGDGFTVENYSGNADGMIFKLNSSGTTQWIKEIIGSTNLECVYKQVNDETGNIYVAGYYLSNSLDIDGTILNNTTTTGKSDIVLIKYNSSGTMQWAKTVGSKNDDRAYHLDTYNDNVIITGVYSDTIIFDTDTLLNSGNFDVFISECNSSGNFINAVKIAGKGSDIGEASIYIKNGRSFVTIGDFYSDTLTLDTYKFANSVQDLTTRDAYIARYGCFEGINMASTPVLCYGGSDGTATATPGEGSAPYTFLWSNAETTATIINLTPGTYTVTITGAGSCSAIDSITITQPNTLSSTTSQTNESCSGSCNGTATVIPSGGTSPYTYLWSTIPEQTNTTATGLCDGIYSVTVTDLNNCTTTNSVTITEPAVLSAITDQNNGCNSSCNKSATVTPSGGKTPYTYLWNDAQTTATATALCAGDYSVTVTDACLNTTTNTVTITEPSVLTTTPSQVEPSIDICNGTATSTPSGGTSPYTYLWSNSQTTNPATSICGGTCSVTVSDANGCTTSGSYTFITAINLTVIGTPTTNSATLAWDGNGATNYHLEYYKAGSGLLYKSSTTSPCTLTFLEPNAQYYCRIRTLTAGGYNSFSSFVNFTTASGSSILAQNLAVVGTPATNSAELTWDGSGADNYQLCYYKSGGILLYKSTTIKPCSLNNLEPNTLYYSKIRTYSGGEWSNWSTTISFTTANGSSILATNLAVVGTPATNSAELTWDGSGADNYQLCYYKTGGTLLYQSTTSKPSTLNNLEPNTLYYCKIRTLSGGEWSNWSTTISFTTANGISVFATNLAVSGTPGTNSVVITWDGSGADNYQICYYKGTLLYKSTTTKPCTLYNLEPNSLYYCKIRTYYGGVWTSWSTAISFTTDNGASTLAQNLSVVGSPTATTATLTWDGSGATNYHICYYKAGSSLLYKSTTTKPYTLTNLTPGTQYYCKIRTLTGGEYSNWSTTINFTTTGTKLAENSGLSLTKYSITSTIFPNPFTYSSNLLLLGNTENPFSVYIYDITGKVISNMEIYCNREYPIGEKLNTGVYFIIITGKDYKETLKIIKTE